MRSPTTEQTLEPKIERENITFSHDSRAAIGIAGHRAVYSSRRPDDFDGLLSTLREPLGAADQA